MRLYVATSNPGKLRDFAWAARAFPDLQIEPLPNLASLDPPDETEETFEGNARLKALAYGALAPEDYVLADDSGLIVPALDGAPGVRSARYADDERFYGDPTLTTDQRNLQCLLETASHLTGEHRKAHYTAVLAAARHGEIVAVATGQVDGLLLTAPRGDAGFGYDPIFLIPSLDQTMAELSPDTRTRLSHRARALTTLLQSLLTT